MLFSAYNHIIESDFDLKLPIVDGIPDFFFKNISITFHESEKTKIFRKGVRAKFFKKENSFGVGWKDIAKFESFDDKILHYQRFTEDLDVFRLFILSEALGLVLFRKNLFLLHGSAVKIGNKGFVFIGKSGVGKSTTVAAFAKAGFEVVSDDMTAIERDSRGKLILLPAFPEIKLWDSAARGLGFESDKLKPAFEGHDKFIFSCEQESTKKPVELTQIIILERPFSNKSQSIKPREKPLELLKYFPLPHQLLIGDSLQKYFDFAVRIAQNTTIQRINRPKNFSKLYDFVNSF